MCVDNAGVSGSLRSTTIWRPDHIAASQASDRRLPSRVGEAPWRAVGHVDMGLAALHTDVAELIHLALTRLSGFIMMQ